MLLERNPVMIGVIAALVIAAATAFGLAMTGDVFRRGDAVVIEFANSQGVSAGDEVQVAGIRAGAVDDVRIAGDLVEVAIVLHTEVPIDSTARVSLRNMLGRRVVEVEPGRDWDNLLNDAEEARIPLERTSTLVDIPDLGDDTVDLLRDADVDALEVLVRSLADVTEDQRDEFGQLLDGLRSFSAVLADNREELAQLIVRSETLVDAAADRDAELVTIIDRFGSTLQLLAERRSELRRLLHETSGTTNAVADLVGEERLALDRILGEVHEVLEMADRHQVDIAHSMAYGGVAFYGFSQVGRSGPADNPYWGNILTTGLGEAGVDAIAGCGGIIDRFLDTVFGPSECPEPGGYSGGEDGAKRDDVIDGNPLPFPSMRSLFQGASAGLGPHRHPTATAVHGADLAATSRPHHPWPDNGAHLVGVVR